MSSQCFADYFCVVLRTSMALEYEFDECAARVEFETVVHMSNIIPKTICRTLTTNREIMKICNLTFHFF
jgi:hypothetical protein